MPLPAISVNGLGKMYRLAHRSKRPDSFREAISSTVLAPFRQLRQLRGTEESMEDFWALKDVSFDVQPGEVVGIIGRNGAGKSTLLKILSRIVEPTAGEIRLRGRVASLLEVGTGFHPDLTGRENIYLNGSILGMKKREIDRKFDEIVDFAEVEKFLDTPVKRYSSGMYVRLAFAVAAHLDPEILIVDEVLAVGDVEFQKKCLGKMKEVSAGTGRTVLFVSHNMAAVSTLTSKTAVLAGGTLQFMGSTGEGIQHYLSQGSEGLGVFRSNKSMKDEPFVSSVVIGDTQGDMRHISGNEMKLAFRITHSRPLKSACFSFQIVNQNRQPIIHCWIYDVDQPICRQAGPTTLVCRIPRLALNVGRYSINTYLSEPPGGRNFESLEGICPFEVIVLDKQTLFGWRPEACGYLESFVWDVSTASMEGSRFPE